METFMPYLLSFLLLLLHPLYLIFFVRRKGSNHLKNPPPGSEGWPVLGENLEFSRLGFQKLVRERMQKHSNHVFKTSLFGETMAVICGAKGNKFIFSNETKFFKRWFPLSLRKTMFQESDRRRSQETKAHFSNFQYDALKPEALKQYIPAMDALAREHLDEGGWRRKAAVKVVPLIKKYNFELVCRLFMDVVDPPRLAKLLEPFDQMSKGMVCLPWNLPATDFNRALKGGEIVREEVMKMITERKKMLQINGGGDLLSKMVMATDEDGRYMSEGEIGNVLIGLLIAGQYEVSSAVAIVVYYLAQLPHIYNQVLEEQMHIAKSKGTDEVLTWQHIEKMKYTWNVVRECFRLTPPSLGSFREATSEITFAGFTIPKGWKIMWTPHSSHMNPDHFPEPEMFDPSRFEGSGPAPYTFVPFGAGSRMCPGMGYAKLAVLVFIHNLVTRFRPEKAIPGEKMLFHRNSPTPAHGLLLRLHPH